MTTHGQAAKGMRLQLERWRERAEKDADLLRECIKTREELGERMLKAEAEVTRLIGRIAFLEPVLDAARKAALEEVDKAAKAEADAARLRAALEGLVTKIDLISKDPRYEAVWLIAQIHNGPYTGPTYSAELDAARAEVPGVRRSQDWLDGYEQTRDFVDEEGS